MLSVAWRCTTGVAEATAPPVLVRSILIVASPAQLRLNQGPTAALLAKISPVSGS